MATNAKKKVADDDQVVDEEELLRQAKYGKEGVESSQETDEPENTDSTEGEPETASDEEGQTDEVATEESEETDETESDEESSFVKEFPYIKGDTPEEYAKNLEEAYKNSTTEALRLKGELEKPSETEEESTEVDFSDPVALFMKQKMDEEIQTAYDEFSKNYSQVADANEYNRFTRTVSQLSATIMQLEKRLASPKELYVKAAVILGWEPLNKVGGKDELDAALKDRASTGKIISTTKPKPAKSLVSDAEITIAKRMWGDGMSDTEIRKELEKVKV